MIDRTFWLFGQWLLLRLVGWSVTTSEEAVLPMKKTTRVQLELAEGSFERLKSLKDKTEATSYSEVIKSALRLYEGLIEEAERGNSLCVKTKDGLEQSYKMLF
jgi:predicted CopG family antitoxin